MRMVIGHWALVISHWSLVISKEVEKIDREGRRETVSRKLVWLFVIWNLDFTHLPILGELGGLFS